MRKALADLAQNMYRQKEFEIAFAATQEAEGRQTDPILSATLALLAAQSREQMFYRSARPLSRIPMPFSSVYTDIPFSAYDRERYFLIEDALRRFDSLLTAPEPVSAVARFHRAGILYRVYHDFDTALKEYRMLADAPLPQLANTVYTRIAELHGARGDYEEGVRSLRRAAQDHGLSAAEEDRLAAPLLLASFLAGETDSLAARTAQTLSLLPENDPLYNDVLGFAGFVSGALKDTLNHARWLEAERLLRRNEISRAAELFETLLSGNSPAAALYGIRCLDCLRLLDDTEREKQVWERYYRKLLTTPSADFFMLRYAEFQEIKMHNLKNAIEIYENYLLSYQESMYYEFIRQYVRQRHTTGAP